MSKFGYITRCIRKMNYGAMMDTVKQVHEKSGKSKIGTFADIIWCGLRYGAGYRDYALSEWWDLNSKQRKTFLTRGTNNSIIKKQNDSSYYHILKNKAEFAEYFGDFIGREQINLQKASFEDFERFIQKHETVIVKPFAENSGRGVFKLSKNDFNSVKEMYEHIKEKNSLLVEECIVQNSKISELYPHSVNTIRMVTLRGNDGKPHILYSCMRLGNNGSVVDNLGSGGMTVPVDLETGIITKVACDKAGNCFDTHPYTGTKLIGFKMPLWDEAKQMVLKAADVIPQLGYIGWDVAITENGAVLVEGNQHPGHDFMQLPPHADNKTGTLPRIKEFINI